MIYLTQTFVKDVDEEERNTMTIEEAKLCDSFTELIQHIYHLEYKISGKDYLAFLYNKKSASTLEASLKQKSVLEPIPEVENSFMVDASV